MVWRLDNKGVFNYIFYYMVCTRGKVEAEYHLGLIRVIGALITGLFLKRSQA